MLERSLTLLAIACIAGCGQGDGAAAADAAGAIEESVDSPSPDDASRAGRPLGDDGSVDARAPAGDGGVAPDMDAARATDACVAGSVTFQIETSPESAGSFCYRFSSPGPSVASWIGVRAAGGSTPMQIADPCPAVSACGACFCNGGFGWATLGDAGSRTTWDGTLFVGDGGACDVCGMCGSCFAKTCAPAGAYVARFCALRQTTDGGCNDRSPTACTEVPFSWPPASGASPIVGVVGP